MPTWWGDSKNREEIEFSRWLFEGRPRQGRNVLPDGLNWLCYFEGSSKPSWEFNFLYIFVIPSSSRLEKRCQILQTLFWVFQYSRNSQRHGKPILNMQKKSRKIFLYLEIFNFKTFRAEIPQIFEGVIWKIDAFICIYLFWLYLTFRTSSQNCVFEPKNQSQKCKS